MPDKIFPPLGRKVAVGLSAQMHDLAAVIDPEHQGGLFRGLRHVPTGHEDVVRLRLDPVLSLGFLFFRAFFKAFLEAGLFMEGATHFQKRGGK